jgi:hypothetical protein
VCEVRARARVDLPEAGIPAMPTRRREEFELVKLDYLHNWVGARRYYCVPLKFCHEKLCEDECLLVHIKSVLLPHVDNCSRSINEYDSDFERTPIHM